MSLRSYILILLVICAAVSLSLGLYAARRWRVPGARPFALMLLGEFVWTSGYILEIAAQTLEGKVLWDNIEFVGLDASVMGLLVFALEYTGGARWPRRILWLLCIEPAINLVMVWTDGSHGLVRVSTRLDAGAAFPVLVYDYGPWFLATAAYVYTVVFCALGILVANVVRQRRTRGHRIYSLQTGAIILGILALLGGGTLSLVGFVPISGMPTLDISPFSFAIANPALAWGLFRYHLLDVVPVARDALVEQMRDGIIVLDAERRVVDLNEAAGKLFGWSSLPALGEQLGPARSLPEGLFAESGPVSSTEVSVAGPDGSQRWLEINVSSLTDLRRATIGWLIVAHDVTDRNHVLRERERLIDELREALAKIKTLRGLLPICSSCKKIRADTGYWEQIERYIQDHSEATVSHGMCPECARRLYPDVYSKMYPEE